MAAATVRGSQSFGMICSAFDLGWAEAADGQAVRLPQDMKLGTALQSEPPEVSTTSPESSPSSAVAVLRRREDADVGDLLAQQASSRLPFAGL